MDQRPENQFHQNGEENDCESVGACDVFQQIEQIEHRAAEGLKPAPVGEVNRVCRARGEVGHDLQIFRSEVELVIRDERFAGIDVDVGVDACGAGETVDCGVVQVAFGRVDDFAACVEHGLRGEERDEIFVGDGNPLERIGGCSLLEFLIFRRRVDGCDAAVGAAEFDLVNIAEVIVCKLFERRERSSPDDDLREVDSGGRGGGDFHAALENVACLVRREGLCNGQGNRSGIRAGDDEFAVGNFFHGDRLDGDAGDGDGERLESLGFADGYRLFCGVFGCIAGGGAEVVFENDFIKDAVGVEIVVGVAGIERLDAGLCDCVGGDPGGKGGSALSLRGDGGGCGGSGRRALELLLRSRGVFCLPSRIENGPADEGGCTDEDYDKSFFVKFHLKNLSDRHLTAESFPADFFLGGTGSYPARQKGLQRRIRHAVRMEPLMAP